MFLDNFKSSEKLFFTRKKCCITNIEIKAKTKENKRELRKNSNYSEKNKKLRIKVIYLYFARIFSWI